MKKKILDKNEAKRILSNLGDEFALVKNPDYVYPDYELYPLAPKIKAPVANLVAAVMDMDGTTTSTELLCIHSLEFMIRKFSGRVKPNQWIGLDEVKDYPHIIGNSTTKHVEFLVKKYESTFIRDEIIKSFLFAAVWTLSIGKDDKRKEEVKNNLFQAGFYNLVKDEKLTNIKSVRALNEEEKGNILKYLFEKYHSSLKNLDFNFLVRFGIDVYYQHYHEILERIKLGEGKIIAEELFQNQDKHLIEAMPGVIVFLPLIKGLIDSYESIYFDYLLQDYELKSGKSYDAKKIDKARNSFIKLCKRFNDNPLKTSIVTSSILYEADIVMREVFNLIVSELEKIIPQSESKRKLLHHFRNYNRYYDAVVTASDSSEIRLKPHRDLYSIGLNKLGIPQGKFNQVIGFEDSESGTIAIRAAGIGLSVAVPFAQTSGHNMNAAAYICKNGLPEVILKHNLFLKD